MDIRDQIINALMKNLGCEFVSLEDDDGITGVAVSSAFEDKSTLDRQMMIDQALAHTPAQLSREETRRILMIAGVTPAEYNAVGAKIRVHRIRKIPNGVEVLLHGGTSDASYVGAALGRLGKLKISEPIQVPGAPGILMKITAKGNGSSHMTKAAAIDAMRKDRYIEVLEGA